MDNASNFTRGFTPASNPKRGIGVVLRKGVPMCDIELVALDLHVLVANS